MLWGCITCRPMPLLSRSLRIIQNSPIRKVWNQVDTSPKHGICVPLFSIHTQNSCGIGEFLDLIPMIDWCTLCGFQILQILPINDTGSCSSPYNSISSISLNPLHLSISALPYKEEVSSSRKLIQEMQRLSQLSQVNYEKVIPMKRAFFKAYFRVCKSKNLTNHPDFCDFCEREKYWLHPYALFCSIREHLNYLPINHWSTTYTDLSYISQHEHTFAKDIEFYSYLQYLCFEQMKQVRKHADHKGCLIKGDIPILISKDSCDVWFYRKYFSSSESVGSPPDFYNAEGQNWNLPIYNMKTLRQDAYHWWKERLRYAENFYSLYRLDHVVGLFRFWVWDELGRGRFEPQDPKDYLDQGTDILSHLLKASSMLPIGEDLGTIPVDVKQALESLAVCGTRIPRWERDWEGNGAYIPFDQYNPLSVTSLSTHDSSTLALWWQEAPQEARLFAQFLGMPYTPSLSFHNHKEILKLSHKTSSIFHINLINDYLALCPDLISTYPLQERINLPGTISKNNWVYRVKPSIEQLSAHSKLNSLLASLF